MPIYLIYLVPLLLTCLRSLNSQASFKMPTFKTSYLVPAILLNPAFILHLFNTFTSYFVPPPYTVSVSPHPFMESLGPLPGTKLAIDVHANEQLCWSYTAVMVLVQCLAFGRVQNNRVRRKSAKAAKIERERLRKEKLTDDDLLQTAAKVQLASNIANHGTDGLSTSGKPEEYTNGKGHVTQSLLELGEVRQNGQRLELESEESMTETSEEEMMV